MRLARGREKASNVSRCLNPLLCFFRDGDCVPSTATPQFCRRLGQCNATLASALIRLFFVFFVSCFFRCFFFWGGGGGGEREEEDEEAARAVLVGFATRLNFCVFQAQCHGLVSRTRFGGEEGERAYALVNETPTQQQKTQQAEAACTCDNINAESACFATSAGQA